MIIYVSYNKSTNELSVTGDVDLIALNSGSIVDDSSNLSFEIAVDTSEYEIDNIAEDIE